MNKNKSPPALLIIDMQKDFVLPGSLSKVDGALKTIPMIRKALEFFRKKEFPIFHVVREYRIDGSDVEINKLDIFMNKQKSVIPGTEGCEIVDELKPLHGEYRIVKNRYSGFMKTELDFMLRRLEIKRIVICGTQYPNCIRASVFDGVSYGYIVQLLTDATSAATPEIARANIIDIQNIGVECLTVNEFIKAESI